MKTSSVLSENSIFPSYFFFDNYIIVLVKWKKIDEGFHFIAGVNNTGGVGGFFEFHNSSLKDKDQKSIDGRHITIWKLLDYIKAVGAIPLMIIGVSLKKGRW